jgi:DNA-directed RNA polymerase subunit beta'
VSAAPIRPIKSLSQAKLILRKKKALGRMILRQIVPRFPVLLNRAPTLHRLGIQGFHPVLVYGRALHLHPLVCGSFNADFDGDQMAVHIPLSLKARFDIRMLMFAPVNWLSPATGQPTVVPSQDMVLGLFYMTLEKIALQKGRGAFFNTLSDAVQAYETGMLEIQSQIWVRWKGPFANNQMNDESSEEMYEDHSKQGKAHALRNEPQFHEDDFQFRRKPFFSENQSHFWKK